MEDLCDVCGKSFEHDPLFCRGRHLRCYYKVYRREKIERDILAEAEQICLDISERFGVPLSINEVGLPATMNPVDWTLACVDKAIEKRMAGVPGDDPLLQLKVLAGETEEAPAEV